MQLACNVVWIVKVIQCSWKKVQAIQDTEQFFCITPTPCKITANVRFLENYRSIAGKVGVHPS